MKFTHNIENESATRGTRGKFAYKAGTSGTVSVAGRVYRWAAHASVAATVTIDSGDTITIPAGWAVDGDPRGSLDSPTFVFTNTDAYFVEYVTGQ